MLSSLCSHAVTLNHGSSGPADRKDKEKGKLIKSRLRNMSHIQESPDAPSASPRETQLIKARKGSTKLQGRVMQKNKR